MWFELFAIIETNQKTVMYTQGWFFCGFVWRLHAFHQRSLDDRHLDVIGDGGEHLIVSHHVVIQDGDSDFHQIDRHLLHGLQLPNKLLQVRGVGCHDLPEHLHLDVVDDHIHVQHDILLHVVRLLQ